MAKFTSFWHIYKKVKAMKIRSSGVCYFLLSWNFYIFSCLVYNTVNVYHFAGNRYSFLENFWLGKGSVSVNIECRFSGVWKSKEPEKCIYILPPAISLEVNKNCEIDWDKKCLINWFLRQRNNNVINHYSLLSDSQHMITIKLFHTVLF